MSDSPKCPHDRTAPTCPPSCEHHEQSVIDLAAARSERQRRAVNDGRPDRVAELAADIEGSYQRAIWSLTVGQALMLSGVLSDANDHDTGVTPSGDHRPRFGRLYAR